MEIDEQIQIMQDSMEESDQPQQLDMDAFHVPLVSSPLLTNQVTATNSPLMTNGLTSQFPYQFAPPYQMAQQVQLHQLMQQDRQLQIFWANQNHEIKNTKDFKNHNLPLARIKKIMKADEDVKMIAAETPVLFSRACEMFILELTYRSWSQAEHSKRRTLQKSDISSAIAKNQLFDFLMDIVPMDDVKDGGAATIPEGEELNEQISCFYDPSKFGPLMVDLRHLPDQNGSHHRLPFGQQHQDCNASAST